MLISQKHGFVFFCMPKCASNSIEAMLKPYSDMQLSGCPRVRHTNVREYRSHIQPYLADVAGIREIETVCLVREPVSWLNSWYRFRARHALRSENHPHSTSHISFEEFLEAYLTDPRPAFADVSCQYDIVRDAAGNIGIDRLFAYHDIRGVVDYFAGKTGQNLKVKALNVSPAKIHASNLMERADSMKRRIVSALTEGVPRIDPGRAGPELAPDLYGRLKSAIPEDFELYGNFT